MRYGRPNREQIARRLRRLVWLSLVLLAGATLLGTIGNLKVRAGMGTTSPFSAQADYTGVELVSLSLLAFALALGGTFVAVMGFILLHGFSLRGLLIGITSFAIIIAGCLTLGRRVELTTIRVIDGDLMLSVYESATYSHWVAMPVWLLVMIATLPLVPLVIIFLWPMRRNNVAVASEDQHPLNPTHPT